MVNIAEQFLIRATGSEREHQCGALALLAAIMTGSSGFGWPDDPVAWRIALELRLPRAVAALVTGGLLALAGVLMQVLLRKLPRGFAQGGDKVFR